MGHIYASKPNGAQRQPSNITKASTRCAKKYRLPVWKLCYYLLAAALVVGIPMVSNGQTVLNLGDIAFTGYRSDAPDQFSIVLINEVDSGTQISFTDRSWDVSQSGGFVPESTSNEGSITVTITSDYACGDELYFLESAGTWSVYESDEITGAGTIAESGTFALFNGGDQIFAYQGTIPTAADESNFLAAIHMNGGWDADGGTSEEDSEQPSTFSNGNYSVVITPEVDGAEFNCAASSEVSASIINNEANWFVDDTEIDLDPWCTFTSCPHNFSFCTDCNSTTGDCAIPNVIDNPALNAACTDLQLAFILDESGSIGGFEDDVEAGTMAFLTSLLGTGTEVALIDFAINASLVTTGYELITQELLDNIQGYFDGTPYNGEVYQTGGSTNWQSAMLEVYDLLDMTDTADMILFFTDGNPTSYSTGTDGTGPASGCSGTGSTESPEIVNPVKIANYLKEEFNTHMFMLGVGSVNPANLQLMSGTTQWQFGVTSIQDADYALESFEMLAECLNQFANELCGTDLDVTLTPDPVSVCVGDTIEWFVTLENIGQVNLAPAVTFRDTLPAGLSIITCTSNCSAFCSGASCSPVEDDNILVWVAGDIPTGGSVSMSFTTLATAGGTYSNIGWAEASVVNPTSDTGVVFVSLLAAGVEGDLSICDTEIETLTATGSAGVPPYSFEWSTGATTESIDISISGDSIVSVTVTDGAGCTDATSVQLTIDPKPDAGVIADVTDLCVGGTAQLTASGSGGVGPYTYDWSDAQTGSVINVSPTDSTTYTVTVTDVTGCSSAAQISINVTSDPTVDVDIEASTICEGGTAMFTANVSGGAGTTTYQWQVDNMGWMNIAGADMSTFTTVPLSVGTHTYRVIVSQNSGCDVTSADAVITVVTDPTVNVSAAEDSICTGGSAILTAEVDGGVGDPVFVWEYFDPMAGWVEVGPSTAVYQIDGLGLGTYEYRVSVNQDAECFAQSANTTITVVTDPSLEIMADAEDVCIGGSVVFSTMITGGAGSSTVTWQYDDPGTGWTDIGTGFEYTTDEYTTVGTYTYRARLEQNSGCLDFSDTIQVTVVTDPLVAIGALEEDICYEGTAVLFADVTGGAGVSVFFWEISDGMGGWTSLGLTSDTVELDGLAVGSYEFRVSVAQNSGCYSTSESIIIDVVDDPFLEIAADAEDICVGGTVTFSTMITGGAGDPVVEWQYQDPMLGWTTVGMGLEYTTDVFNSIGSYNYRALLNQNSGCFFDSAPITITVVTDPTIGVSAEEEDICFGGTAVLTASISGGAGDPVYTWEYNDPMAGWIAVGPTTDVYNINGLDVGSYEYRVSVNQNSGCFATSSSIIIEVFDDPVLEISADAEDICIGGTVTFSTSVTGGAGTPTITWEYNDPMFGWTEVGSGLEYTTQVFNMTGTYSYRALLQQNSGCFDDSDPVVITVVTDPTVSVSAAEEDICFGGTAVLTANVMGGAGDPLFTWEYNDPMLGWTVVGPTTFEYQINGLDIGSYEYRVSVNQNSGCFATSASIIIDVVDDPVLDIEADDESVCIDGTVTFSTMITGGAGDPTVVWQYDDPMTGWTDVGMGLEYTTDPFTQTGTYTFRARLSQNSGCSDTSQQVVVTVVNDPTVSVNADEDDICFGGTAVLNADVIGGTGSPVFTWEYNDPMMGWTTVGPTISTYEIMGLDIGSYEYRVSVQQNSGCFATSASIIIDVLDDPVLEISADAEDVCIGGTVTFSTMITGGAGSPTVTWEYDDPMTGWTMVGTGLEFTTDVFSATGTYDFRALLDQNSGCFDDSDPITVTVVDDPTISLSAEEEDICFGGTAVLNASITGGAGDPVYTWEYNDPMTGWTVVGPTTADYEITGLAIGSYEYRVSVNQNSGCFATSASLIIDVVDDPVVTIEVDAEDVCVGGTVTFTSMVSGGAGSETIRWFYNDPVDGWVFLASGPEYTTDVFTQTGTYVFRARVIMNSGCSDFSNQISIDVVDDPTVNISAVEEDICFGGTAVLMAEVNGGAGTPVFTWEYNDPMLGWTVVGPSTGTYNVMGLDIGSHEYRVSVDQNSGCFATSASLIIDVVDDPVLEIDADAEDVCVGGTVTFNSSVTGGTGSPSIDWQYLDPMLGWVVVGSGPDYTTDVFNSTGSYEYRAVLNQNSGCFDDSDPIVVNVVDDPIVEISAVEEQICVGGTAVLVATVSGGAGDPEFTWEYNAPGSGWTILGPTTDTFEIMLGVGVYEFRVSVNQNSGCYSTSASIFVQVVDDPDIFIISDDESYCEGSSAILTATVVGGAGDPSFQWQFNDPMNGWVDVGTNSFEYVTPPLPVGTLEYRVIVTQNSGCQTQSGSYFISAQFCYGIICGTVSDEFGNPLSNVTLELYADSDEDGSPDGMLIQSTQTDGETGMYCFEDVEPGSYVVVEIQPDNYEDISDYDTSTGPDDPDGDDSADGPDNEIPVQLADFEADLDNDFVEDPAVAYIFGKVEEDTGLPIEDVVIELHYDFDQDGVEDGLISVTQTDSLGEYQFYGVEVGHYLLVEQQPLNYNSFSDFDASTGAGDPDGNDSALGPNERIPVTLAAGEVDTDNDFIEDPFPGIICGNVSDDFGNPLSNVTLELYADTDGDGTADGMAIATTSTDGETGDYCFEDVEPGDYVVVEIQPDDYDDISDFDASTGQDDPDGDDSGEGPDNDIPVTLEPGEADLNNDFIEDPNLAFIYGNVREDNGAPIEGVTIELHYDFDQDGSADALLSSTVTDAQGDYEFIGIEIGGYVLVELQPLNYNDISDFDSSTGVGDPDGDDSGTGPDNDIPVVLAAGELDEDNDFIEDPFPGIICGNVSDDLGNPLSNVTIELYADTNGDGLPDGVPVLTTSTDGETGDYCFEDVEVGTYVIVEIQPDDYDDISDFDTSTGPDDPDGDDSGEGADNNIPVILTAGEADLNNDFVEDPNLAFIYGNVSDDTGSPIAGVVIELHNDFDLDGNADAFISSTVTDAAGDFEFIGIEIGGYVLVEQQPDNYSSDSDFDMSTGAGDPDGDDSGSGPDDDIPVILAAGELDEDNDFIEDPFPGLICGNVSDDFGNPLSNVELQLFADTNGDGEPDGGVITTTTTDGETGDYCFEEVEPGDYVVVQVQPNNYNSISDYDTSTGPDDPDGDDSGQGADDNIPVTVTAGEADLNNDFVEDPSLAFIYGNVSDNAVQPLEGVVIELYSDPDFDGNPDGFISNTVTDAMGDYEFIGVEIGAYVVVQQQPANYFDVSDYDESTGVNDPDGDDSADGPDNEIPVVLTAGELDEDNDFIEDPFPGIICGNVSDEFGNPLSNVTLELYADTNGDGVPDGTAIATTTTDGETGDYCFEDVPVGDYVVVQIQPDHYDSISDFDGSVDADDPDGDDSGEGPDNNIPVTITPGEADFDNDFVEDPEVAFIYGNVSDDTGLPLPDVTIDLYTDTEGDGVPDVLIISTTTDGAGDYEFSGVEIGSYVVVQQQPANHFSVSDYDGSTGVNDPDGDDSIEGPDDNIPVVLVAAELDEDNDFVEDPFPGIVCGTVMDDTGNPLSNVEIELYADTDGDGNPDGSPIATTTTDGETGLYCFEDVEPGDYVIVEIQPNNFDDVSDFDSSTGPDDPDGDDSGQGPDNNIPVTVTPGEGDNDNDFIEDPNPGTISGNVQDEYGVNMPDITIELFFDSDLNDVPDGAAVGTTTTDASGNFMFSGVEPGQYLLVETQLFTHGSLSDFDMSTGGFDPDGNDEFQGPDDNIFVQVAPGEDDEDNDFINDAYPGLICGVITDDLGEPISGVQLILYADSNGDGVPDGQPLDTVDVDGDSGQYCFEDVEYGDYVVVEIQPDGYGDDYDFDESTGPDDPDGDDSGEGSDNNIPVTITPTEGDFDNNFAELRCPGIPQIEGDSLIYTCDSTVVVFTAIEQLLVDATYHWNFGEGATPDTASGIGPHEVLYAWNGTNEDPGAAVTLTISKEGCPDETAQVATVIVSPPTDVAIDADLANICVGISRDFQPAADSIPGATYTWNFGAGALPATATGYGPHTVVYDNEGLKEITLIVDPNNTEIANCPDTGVVQITVVDCIGSVAGTVRTNDGAPIEGSSLILYLDPEADGIIEDQMDFIEFTNTNSSGEYAFTNLDPGDYIVLQIQPSGYTSVFDGDTTEVGDIDNAENLSILDNLIPVTVKPLEDDITNIFIETNAGGSASINGRVSEDLNGSGELDPGEGISPVTIELFEDMDEDGSADSGTPVAVVETNRVGWYIFYSVAPGSYVIVETQPVGYANGVDVDSGTDTNDVENTNEENDTIPSTVTAGEVDSYNDFLESFICSTIVTNTGDDGPGSLRFAIGCVNPGSTITFAPAIHGDTIYLTSDAISLNKNITISGLGQDITVATQSLDRVFEVPVGFNVSLLGLDIVGGMDAETAAAILNSGDLTLDQVTLRANPDNQGDIILIENNGELILNGQIDMLKE